MVPICRLVIFILLRGTCNKSFVMLYNISISCLPVDYVYLTGSFARERSITDIVKQVKSKLVQIWPMKWVYARVHQIFLKISAQNLVVFWNENRINITVRGYYPEIWWRYVSKLNHSDIRLFFVHKLISFNKWIFLRK